MSNSLDTPVSLVSLKPNKDPNIYISSGAVNCPLGLSVPLSAICRRSPVPLLQHEILTKLTHPFKSMHPMFNVCFDVSRQSAESETVFAASAVSNFPPLSFLPIVPQDHRGRVLGGELGGDSAGSAAEVPREGRRQGRRKGRRHLHQGLLPARSAPAGPAPSCGRYRAHAGGIRPTSFAGSRTSLHARSAFRSRRS